MRDYESEREKVKGVRVYETEQGPKTVAGYSKPYNDLLYALEETAREMQHTDRRVLQKIAWSLGCAGERHACEVIMKHAKEPIVYGGFMYGVPPVD